MSERSPPADFISAVICGVTEKLTPRTSTNCSTREDGMPPCSIVTISLFESGSPEGTGAPVLTRGVVPVRAGCVLAVTPAR